MLGVVKIVGCHARCGPGFVFGNANTRQEYARLRDAIHVSVVDQRSENARSHLDAVAHAQVRVDEKRASLKRANDASALSHDLSSLKNNSKGAGVHRRIRSTLQPACRRALNPSAKRSTIASVCDRTMCTRPRSHVHRFPNLGSWRSSFPLQLPPSTTLPQPKVEFSGPNLMLL